MENSTPSFQSETKFNAGISVAEEIGKYVRDCGEFAFNGQYAPWHRKLQIIERRMSFKFRKNETALTEIENIHKKFFGFFSTYLHLLDRRTAVPFNIINSVKEYLSEYERALLFYRDKFGYGMPEKMDALEAAWH